MELNHLKLLSLPYSLKLYRDNKGKIDRYFAKMQGKPVEGYDGGGGDSNDNKTIAGVGIGLFVLILIIGLGLFIWWIIALVKFWNYMPQVSRWLALILGIFLPGGVIIGLIIIYATKKSYMIDVDDGYGPSRYPRMPPRMSPRMSPRRSARMSMCGAKMHMGGAYRM